MKFLERIMIFIGFLIFASLSLLFLFTLISNWILFIVVPMGIFALLCLDKFAKKLGI